MNKSMDPNFRYYDCSNIVDEITGEEQENLKIMVAVPRIDLSTAEEQTRKHSSDFRCCRGAISSTVCKVLLMRSIRENEFY